jgi:hypothetical protein
LIEVAAAVATHLKTHGIEVVVVRGSATTAHVPNVYTSMDVDFAVTSDIDRRKINLALAELGFHRRGQTFVHPDTAYSLDFVADRPYVEQQAVYDFAEIPTPLGNVRVLYLEDAIADRIAGFLHWSGSESLNAAERAAADARDRLPWERIDAALQRLDTSLPGTALRMALARERLHRAVAGD